VSNQDVFRWPGITQGTERQLLGMFVTVLEMPGIPMVSWGEEQAFYALDNTASNYVFGRQAMTASRAWQMHGCYKVGDSNIFDMPFNTSLNACHDESMSLDHRDPSSPLYNVYKSMFELRSRYPALNDGWTLSQFSNQTKNIFLPGSGDVPTETGMWSVARSRARDVQNFDGTGQGNQTVWLVYSNRNVTHRYTFDCSSTLPGRHTQALLSPFNTKTTVKNLLYPYDEYELEDSRYSLGEYLVGSDVLNGCLPQLSLDAFGFKAFVPKEAWLEPSPRITKFLPGHDFRYMSTGSNQAVQIQLHFSTEMNCDQIARAITIDSTTPSNITAELDRTSIRCQTIQTADESSYEAVVPSTWIFAANISNVTDGIHTVSVNNASNRNATLFTNAKDTFMFRMGSVYNPMVFPSVANYSSTLLGHDDAGMYINHHAAGADLFRYSFDWGSSWSDWETYTGDRTLVNQDDTWSGTTRQAWTGTHVKVQYWSKKSGSSSQMQEGDLNPKALQAGRRWPHLFLHGSFNEYGFDAGIFNVFAQDTSGYWNFNFMTEWPTNWQANIWGINPDGLPDLTGAYGDVDGDQVLDRLPPVTLEHNVANITTPPPSRFLGWWIHINDADLRYYYIPVGSAAQQLVLYILLLAIPPVTGMLAVSIYKRSYYQVKHNRFGILDKGTFIPIKVKSTIRRHFIKIFRLHSSTQSIASIEDDNTSDEITDSTPPTPPLTDRRSRRILIATMEYDIPDWEIKIKIGGLGVMSHLMGKHLTEHELIWIVPCVGGIEYPVDTVAESIEVTIFGNIHEVDIQTHKVNNITYVLLDAPIFRGQTKVEPYPARMDDLGELTNRCLGE
jgi:alpha-1,3-glucan synthase